MTDALPPGSTIGIVGGGQLGRMSAMAAARLGYRAHIFATEASSPASQVSAATTVGAYDDVDALARFARDVDVVTFEFENISAAGLELLAGIKPVRPGPAVLRASQDRVTEKCFINAVGGSTASWAAVNNPDDLASAVAEIGLPSVLKTTRLGYDGRGQAVLRERGDAEAAWERLAPRPLVLEAFVDFACEISVVVARGLDGSVAAFDAVENWHRHHILDLTLAPARISAELAENARATAIRVAAGLGVVGLLAVEMFVDRDGKLLVNELAPRPHNSGHWTIDACPASQFEMHIRAVAGLPLPPATRHSDAVMKNLVGPDDLALWPEILATPGLIPHLYGKAEARPGRKMGHVTRLFPRGALPGEHGVRAVLGVLADGESK
ncbi:MAG: 5-(carboxyamino)imidazole ribonucleotide synthase [Rhodospirillales bacterium]